MDLDTYRQCAALAQRLSYRPEHADDLLHQALLIAVRAGRLHLDQPGEQAWLAGVIKKQAAQQYRNQQRRLKRDQSWQQVQALNAVENEPGCEAMPVTGSAAVTINWLEQLPPAARIVVVLVLHGLNSEEIRWILSLNATAWRQRLTRIRKALADLTPESRQDVLAQAYAARLPANASPDLPPDLGLIRRALIRALQQRPGIGASDPDGHLFILDAHTSANGGNNKT